MPTTPTTPVALIQSGGETPTATALPLTGASTDTLLLQLLVGAISLAGGGMMFRRYNLR